MLDIKEISTDFQKMNKMDNCIVIHLKTDQKIIITSTVCHVLVLMFLTSGCASHIDVNLEFQGEAAVCE